MPIPVRLYQANVAYRVSRLYSYRGPQWVRMPKALLRPCRNSPFTIEGSVNGMGKIAGVVTSQGVPAKSRVVALSGRGLRPYGDVYSDPETGAFVIWPLPKNSRYVVLTRDDRTRFNAVIYDGVLPVNWEDEE